MIILCVHAEQLNKIDEDMKKLHEDKLRILRAMQKVRMDSLLQSSLTKDSLPQSSVTKEEDSTSKGIIWSTIEQGLALRLSPTELAVCMIAGNMCAHTHTHTLYFIAHTHAHTPPSHTAGEITATVSHIMVPNPTKGIIAETQHKLTNVITELQKNLSRLLILTEGGQSFQGSVARCVCVCVCMDEYGR